MNDAALSPSPSKPTALPAADDPAILDAVADVRRRLVEQLHRVIVGQDVVIERLLVGLLSRGHCLLVGVPGLAKTLLIRTLAEALDLSFSRIQFTPDLMPTDITGTDVLDQRAFASGSATDEPFRFVAGPIFANIVLADEINRTPPKTQSALLQAMQEREVSAGSQTRKLPSPFFVLATQNPLEQEGTYPLPEAQLDRFMFQIDIGYPSRDEERQIVRATTLGEAEAVEPVLSGADILRIQQAVRQLPVSDHVVDYAVDLTRATRPNEPDARPWAKEMLSWGAGPRAAQNLVLGAKARAVLEGRANVSCDDVRAIATAVLAHRIFCNYNADAEGHTPTSLVERLIAEVPEPTA